MDKTKADQSKDTNIKDIPNPSPADFDNFLPWACAHLQVKVTIIVTRKLRGPGKSVQERAGVKTKLKTETISSLVVDTMSETAASEKTLTGDLLKIETMYTDILKIETMYNEQLSLVQIKFLKSIKIPRIVMKIINLAVPYHPSLSSIVITGGQYAETIYEISKLLPTSQITEIYLDGTAIAEANYYLVLKNNVIKHLSLAKCNINDDVVKTIAAELIRPNPASDTLSALNLSTNRITDVGAKYLAEVLRTNRQLSYLNLADNMISDNGASKIFETLGKFLLTNEEIENRKQRFIKYLKQKHRIILETVRFTMTEFEDKKNRTRSPKITQRRKTTAGSEKSPLGSNKTISQINSAYIDKAVIIAESIVGPFKDAFSRENIEIIDDVMCCFGNNTLTYLNVAYNNFTLVSLRKLCGALMTQNSLCRKPRGLIGVRVEGNYLPEVCEEFKTIDYLLEFSIPTIVKKRSVMSKGSSK